MTTSPDFTCPFSIGDVVQYKSKAFGDPDVERVVTDILWIKEFRFYDVQVDNNVYWEYSPYTSAYNLVRKAGIAA